MSRGLGDVYKRQVYPFHCDCIGHYTKHGFAYMGMKTIVTDVVRENNQTYRLGWTEQCKDGTKMGVGMPEYLLIFRKPATDRTNAYADIPVVKDKKWWNEQTRTWDNPDGYSRARWQMDAHSYTRSSGDRLMTPAEIAKMDHKSIFRFFKKYSLNEVWDYDYVVKIAEELELHGKLPTGFMLLQPGSWTDEVWSDVARMRTLNTIQSVKGKEQHLCPLQFDIVNRVIEQMSNPGDIVLDPFGGLMTVLYCALNKGRKGWGIELSPVYFLDGAQYCAQAANNKQAPSLFDLLDDEPKADEDDLPDKLK